MSPEHSLKRERWQGPPHINKVNQYEAVLSFKVSYVLSLYSVMKTKRILFFKVYLGIKIFSSLFWLKCLTQKTK